MISSFTPSQGNTIHDPVLPYFPPSLSLSLPPSLPPSLPVLHFLHLPPALHHCLLRLPLPRRTTGTSFLVRIVFLPCQSHLEGLDLMEGGIGGKGGREEKVVNRVNVAAEEVLPTSTLLPPALPPSRPTLALSCSITSCCWSTRRRSFPPSVSPPRGRATWSLPGIGRGWWVNSL